MKGRQAKRAGLRPTLSGGLPVKSQCLPFSQIPHTTRLFTDFLSYSQNIRPFYPRSPHFKDWLKEEASSLRYDSTRRELVTAILERQNRAWGASPETLDHLARLRHGALAAVTGQQVGLFGGPVFSLFKALSAVRLASEATAAGVDCVPVFWLATEDHDLAEVNHISIPGSDGTLQKLSTSTHGVADARVGDIRFGPEIESVVEAAVEWLGDSDASRLLGECYRTGETMGGAFARLFARLFADWGVILLDAADPELHQVAEPIYRAGIERAAELADLLLARGAALEAAGYHQQVKVSSSSTLLFAQRDGSRVPVHRRGSGGAQGEFVIGEETVAQPELLRRIAAEPHHFSANVMLRPVVQDYLLPTLAYTGGAAEAAYFAQAAVVFQALLGRVTPIVPRFSATIIEAKPHALLERYRLGFGDLLQGAEKLRELLAARSLPQDLQRAFEEAGASLETSMAVVRSALESLDRTLIDAATHASEKMHYQLSQLRARAARAELRQAEILGRHADLLSNAVFPNKTLQEREVAGIYFMARYGNPLLQELCDTIRPDCLDHQVISL
jgi:bacillithiol biosynthesis cysteine-adding enzyme BshC